nr:plasmid recombination protein [uncultured Oscillibacter sp.]
MAHIAKYKAHSVGHMLAHYRRDPSCFQRDNVDPSRVGSDYTLGLVADPARGAWVVRNVDAKPNWDVVRRRIERVDADAVAAGRRRTRKDAVVLADLVITLPDNVPPEDERRFFGYAYAWLAGKVGRENLMGGFVHRDEVRTGARAGQPVRDHMHVPFTPILDGRFNYKRMVPREFYQAMHKELGDYLEKRMGYRPHVELSAEERAERVYADKSGDIDRVRKAVEDKTEDARQELAGVVADLGNKTAAVRAADAEIAEKSERLECLQAAVTDAESLAQEGVAGLRRVAREGEFAGERERRAREKNRELRDRVAALEGERRELGDRIAALEGEKASAPAAIQDLERDVRRLGGRVRELRRERCELGGRVQGLERRAAQLRELLEGARARLGKLASNVERLLTFRPRLVSCLSRSSADLLRSWGMLPETRQAARPESTVRYNSGFGRDDMSPDDLIRGARADVESERQEPQRRRGGGIAR